MSEGGAKDELGNLHNIYKKNIWKPVYAFYGIWAKFKDISLIYMDLVRETIVLAVIHLFAILFFVFSLYFPVDGEIERISIYTCLSFFASLVFSRVYLYFLKVYENRKQRLSWVTERASIKVAIRDIEKSPAPARNFHGLRQIILQPIELETLKKRLHELDEQISQEVIHNNNVVIKGLLVVVREFLGGLLLFSPLFYSVLTNDPMSYFQSVAWILLITFVHGLVRSIAILLARRGGERDE